MGSQKRTVYDVQQCKGKTQLLEVYVDNAIEASAADEAGIDMFTCVADERVPALREAAPNAFIQAGFGTGKLCSPEEGIRKGFAMLENGADAIYFSGGLGIVEAMANQGIPVTGHVGLVPLLSTWTGYRAVGKTNEEAVKLFRHLKDLENAGAWATELEVVPSEIATYLTQNTSLITEGMGSGPGCDTQYLFSCDILGTNTEHYPRHSKTYADLRAEEERLHYLRVSAFKAFVDDVNSGGYPQPEHEISVEISTLDEFISLVEHN